MARFRRRFSFQGLPILQQSRIWDDAIAKIGSLTERQTGLFELDEGSGMQQRMNSLNSQKRHSIRRSLSVCLDTIQFEDDEIDEGRGIRKISAPNKPPISWVTQMHLWILVGNKNSIDFAEACRRRKPNPQFEHKGYSLIHRAARRGRLKNLRLLLAYGHTDLSKVTGCEETPLHLACQSGHCETIKLLVELGADINAKDMLGNTPMHYLVINGGPDTIDWMLKKGADMRIKNNSNLRAFEMIDITYDMSEVFRSIVDQIKGINIGIHQFDIMRQLGSKIYGDVFQVKHKVTQKKYRMKAINKSYIVQNDLYSYVENELSIKSEICSQFIVQNHFYFTTDSQLFLVDDFTPYGTLNDQLRHFGSLSENRARFYICQIMVAIDQLQSHKRIYGQLRPSTVMLDEIGNSKIFGFARFQPDEFFLEYVPPEVILRKDYTYNVDLYQIGILLYHLLAGRVPFRTSSKDKTVEKIIKAELIFPSNIQDPARHVITKLLNKNPEQRPKLSQLQDMPFFESVDWQQVFDRDLTPPQPVRAPQPQIYHSRHFSLDTVDTKDPSMESSFCKTSRQYYKQKQK